MLADQSDQEAKAIAKEAMKRLYGRNRAFQIAKAQDMEVKEMKDKLEMKRQQ